MLQLKNIFQKKKTTQELVEEIHHTFYTEVDRLLAAAKIITPIDVENNYKLKKMNRLIGVGFMNSIEVAEAKAEVARLDVIDKENKAKQELAEVINYFSFRYPNYKFITEESVKKICEKYNLVYGTIDRYIGTVPSKNLTHIEQFRVNDEDRMAIEQNTSFRSMFSVMSLSKRN